MAGFAPAVAPTIARHGSKLVVPVPLPGQWAVLPPLCVRCGAPAGPKAVKKAFYWHHPALYILLLSPIIYVIVALIVRKTIRVQVPLCPAHAQRRSTAVTLAWALPLIGVADIFVLPRFNVDLGIAAFLAVILFLAGLVTWAVVSNPIRPTSIDNYYGEFSGCCEVFLQQFPQATPAPVMVQQSPPPPPRA